jgi:peroxiredoxin family protein
MDDGEGTLSIALLSGTDDKLNAAALLTAGAAALGRKVDILLQYWALDAFRAGNTTKDHGLAVLTREVVDTANRWLAAESGVGTVMVVAMDPGWQGPSSGSL